MEGISMCFEIICIRYLSSNSISLKISAIICIRQFSSRTIAPIQSYMTLSSHFVLYGMLARNWIAWKLSYTHVLENFRDIQLLETHRNLSHMKSVLFYRHPVCGSSVHLRIVHDRNGIRMHLSFRSYAILADDLNFRLYAIIRFAFSIGFYEVF